MKIKHWKIECVALVDTRDSIHILIMNFIIFILISLLLHTSKGQEVDEAEPKKIKIDGSQALKALGEKIQSCTNETGISDAQRANIFGNDYSDESREVKVN